MLFRIFDIGGTLLVAPFVVSARPLDLLLCAKDLFVAAKVVGIHRTEIDRTATDARATSCGTLWAISFSFE